MLYRISTEDGFIVDWDRMLARQGDKALNVTEQLLALRYLRDAFTTMHTYTSVVHVPATMGARNIPSLLQAVQMRAESEYQAVGMRPLEAREWWELVDSTLMGLCNVVMIMLAEVRDNILLNAAIEDMPVPMMVEEEGGLLMPLKVLSEIQGKMAQLSMQLMNEMEQENNDE